MRDIVLHIYNTIGAILWPIFAVAMIVYVLWMLSQVFARVTSRANPPDRTDDEINDDINEQW